MLNPRREKDEHLEINTAITNRLELHQAKSAGNRRTIKSKMAARKSIGAELFEEIEKRDYCQYVDLFPRTSPMTSTDLRMFRKRTKDRYLVETDQFYSRKGTTKPNGIYELFGKMVNKTADKIREDLVDWSNNHRTEVTEAGTVMFNNDKKSYPWWILTTTHRKNPVDELSLWGLCKMHFKHAVVYTADHTWTTLRDKSLEIAEIDKICDVYLAYMGYGKFANITAKDTNVTVGVQPTLQTLSNKPKINVPTPRQPTNRTRHGQHPTRTASAHINYFNLNQGDSVKERKSPRKHKKRSVSALTLRTPSESRIASQTHIEREKDKQKTTEHKGVQDLDADTDIQITAILSPDEDGTAFTRTLTPKPLPQKERSLSTAKSPKPNEMLELPSRPTASILGNTLSETSDCGKTYQHEKDEHLSRPSTECIDMTPSEVDKGETVERSPQPSTSTPTILSEGEHPGDDAGKATPSNQITTVAEINLCTKHFHLSQQLLPLMNQSTIKREDASTQDPEGERDEHENDTIPNPVKPTLTIPEAVTSTSNTETQTRRTSNNETDEQTPQSIVDDNQQYPIPQPVLPSSEPEKRTLHPQKEYENETDEQNMQAADGLLMLQKLAQFDNPYMEDDANSQLMPIGTELNDINSNIAAHKTTDPAETGTQTLKDDSSEETIIYDTSEFSITAEVVPVTNEDLAPTPSTLDLEKDEQSVAQDRDKKGKLVIRQVGLKKGGTQKDTEDDTPLPTITSSGKVRCNFCRRDFDTMTEQKQHMSRRHPDLLREQEEKRKREKDERIEREQFKQAIETLNKQKLQKDKNRKNTIGVNERKNSPGHKRKHKKDEPPRKRQKRTDNTTSSQRRYSCPSGDCNKSFNTQAELNRHHKDNHPPVICTVCKKVCSTPNTLDRHMYTHRSTLECQYCDEKFAFRSELEIHQTVHDEEPTFYCKLCTRSFMRLGDLREHEESHTGVIHYCTVQGCDFSAPLKRYVKTHIKTTHASKDALPYPCTKCNRRFKFYEQRKRHLSSDH